MGITEEEVIHGKELESFLRKSMQFEYCTFKNCDFTGRNPSGITFLECEFIDCDLSGVELVNTGFKEVRFRSCKLMGLRFDQCNQFLLAMNFDACKLDFSSFFQVDLKGASIVNCSCLDCDFVEATFTGGSFSGSDLTGASFGQTNLEKVDFSNVINLVLDPEENKIQQAIIDRNQLEGLLAKYKLSIR
ncbi:MAG: pentapeptide repeat-containing protein [Cytophagia bacterium]|nr:pentapeptide repeat-containing protein [Cytophagia bacterium]